MASAAAPIGHIPLFLAAELPGVKIEMLGRGKFGSVVKVSSHLPKASFLSTILNQYVPLPFALKIADKQKNAFRGEISFLKRTKEGGITPKMLFFLEAEGHAYLGMQYIEGKDLEQNIEDNIKNNKQFTTAQVAAFAFKGFSALKYLATQGIVHEDIKPKNIFFTVSAEDRRLVRYNREPEHASVSESFKRMLDCCSFKIIGGKSIQRIAQPTNTFGLTKEHLSANIILAERAATINDVFSFVTVVYEIYAQQILFSFFESMGITEVSDNFLYQLHMIKAFTGSPEQMTLESRYSAERVAKYYDMRNSPYQLYCPPELTKEQLEQLLEAFVNEKIAAIYRAANRRVDSFSLTEKFRAFIIAGLDADYPPNAEQMLQDPFITHFSVGSHLPPTPISKPLHVSQSQESK